MKKVKFSIGTYDIATIKVAGDKVSSQAVYGQLSLNFGINYKSPEHQRYTVSHLKTGYKVWSFEKFRQAKQFIIAAEAIPDIADMTIDNCRNYTSEIQQLVNNINWA